MTPPIFVISLARAKDRRADIIRRLEKDGLRYEIVDAVDGLRINRADYADRLEQYHRKEGSCFRMIHFKGRCGEQLRAGEIGCYLSHYNLWRRIADEKIPAAIVLEDDAIWNSHFAEVIKNAMACDWEWDVIRLFHGTIRQNAYRILQPLGGGYDLVQLRRSPDCTTAYLISSAGAEKLLNHCWLMHSPIDEVWRDEWNWNGRVYAVRPYPVAIQNAPSTIREQTEKCGAKSPGISLRTAVRHFLIKQKHQIIRRFYRFRMRPKRKAAVFSQRRM